MDGVEHPMPRLPAAVYVLLATTLVAVKVLQYLERR
jgi:hypothetical protein